MVHQRPIYQLQHAEIHVDGALFWRDWKRRSRIHHQRSCKKGAAHGVAVWPIISSATSAEEVEALASRKCPNMVAEWIRGKVILESDCAESSRRWGPKRRTSQLCFIIEEVREICTRISEVTLAIRVYRYFGSGFSNFINFGF